MVGLSVSSITSRSMPMPMPPVGGIPYSKAIQKSSSIIMASSSPLARSMACCTNRSRWSMGSLSSLKALAYSWPAMNSSNRSVTWGWPGLRLDRGEISTG